MNEDIINIRKQFQTILDTRKSILNIFNLLDSKCKTLDMLYINLTKLHRKPFVI